jgi:YegS/Rv2252/BmrU family lipid kinase
MQFHKAKVILNPVSNHGETKKIVPKIKALLKSRIPFEAALTKKPKDAVEIAKEAKGFDLLIVVGGDGTVHEAVNGLLASKNRETALAVIPSGSGNDFAKMIGMPKKIPLAVERILEGKVKYVDVGKINESYFVNSLGIGFDARVAHLTNKIKNEVKKSGLLLYLTSLFQILRKDFHTHEVQISIDEGVLKSKNITLIAANMGKTYGGGFKITPLARNDDGYIDVCVVDSLTRNQILLRLPFVILGKHLWMKKVHYYKARKLIIKSKKELPAHLDGELIKTREFTVKIIPRALKVVVGKV